MIRKYVFREKNRVIENRYSGIILDMKNREIILGIVHELKSLFRFLRELSFKWNDICISATTRRFP